MTIFEQNNTETPDVGNTIFRLAIDFVDQTSQHIFLTGKAGTGKTTFLRYISKNSHKQVLVAAPTGVAAINAGGVTLHSLFQLSFEPYIPNSRIKNFFKFSKAKIDLLRQLELLIIDEVSMLRVDMLDAIDNTLRFIRRDKRPFGGVQMLYIGDMFQLPPVVKNETWDILKEYYTSPFFFHAKVIEQIPPIYLELKKIYRQREQFFVDLLNRVRNDKLTQDDITQLNARYNPNFNPPQEEKYIILTTHNIQADRINDKKMETLPHPVYDFPGEVKGDFPEFNLPTDMVLRLKKGAQIMFIKNDTSEARLYFNGKLAEIVHIDKDSIYATPIGSTEEIKINKEQWRHVQYKLNKEKGEIEEEELGSFVQYPIRTAWAITIHKSQGLTFERAIIDMGKAFASGQAYVALSRCTSLEGIVLQSPITSKAIQTNEYAITFSREEKPELVLQELLIDAKQRFWAERLVEYFDWKPLFMLLQDYKKLTEDKLSEELRSAHNLADMLLTKYREQECVVQKFQMQLKQLIGITEQNSDLKVLKERCSKAVTFFYEEIHRYILQPLQNHKIAFSKKKKAQAYWKALNILEDNIIMFTMKLTLVRYHHVLLVEDLVFPSLRAKTILSEIETNGPISPKDKTKPKKEKVSKGASAMLSFDMWHSGKTIAAIASIRNLAESTIMGHLLDFIKTGELPVTTLVSQEKVDIILPLVEVAITGEKTALGTLKEQLGDAYSYFDIKAVINHWLWKYSEV